MLIVEALILAMCWFGFGFGLMYLADHSTGYAMGSALIRRRRYLSPVGVLFWLCLLWPAGLAWYVWKWRRLT